MSHAQGAKDVALRLSGTSPFATECLLAGAFERYAGLWPGTDRGSSSLSCAAAGAVLSQSLPSGTDQGHGVPTGSSDAPGGWRAKPCRRRRARNSLLVAISLAFCAVGALAVVWLVVLHPEATRVGLRQALALYHRDAAQHGHAGGPSPGVYRYATSGLEHLSFGGITRRFPGSSTMIVSAARCTTFTWEPLLQHIETLTVCPEADGTRSVRRATTTETIAGTTNTSVIRCPASAWFLPAHPVDGQRWHANCTMADHHVAFDGAVLGKTQISVAGRQVPALRTRLTWVFAGTERGVNPNEYWLDPDDAMILAQHETVDIAEGAGPLGSIRYSEEMTIRLRSLEPAR